MRRSRGSCQNEHPILCDATPISRSRRSWPAASRSPRSSLWSARGSSAGRRCYIGVVSLSLAVAALVSISRTYIVRLQDRIIMLEMKVRCAEVLTAGPGGAARPASSQADRRAALCVRRRAGRAARACGARQAAASRDQARGEGVASRLPSHMTRLGLVSRVGRVGRVGDSADSASSHQTARPTRPARPT